MVLTFTPLIAKLLDEKVRFDVELPTCNDVELIVVRPTFTADVLRLTSAPTLTLLVKPIEVALMAAAFTTVLLAVNVPFTTSPFFTTNLKLLVVILVPFYPQVSTMIK
jgi:hypothetical protein